MILVYPRRACIGVLMSGVIVREGVAGSALHSRIVSASNGLSTQKHIPNLALGTLASPERLNATEALAILKTKLTPMMFTHLHSVEYGSFEDPGLSLQLEGPTSAIQQVGKRDEWKITFTGLHQPRPCVACRQKLDLIARQ